MPPVELPVEISPSFEEYKKAAEKWERVYVKVPVLSAKDTTKYMTGLPGCRTNQHIGTAESKAQFYPYVANKRGNANTKITFETLEIFFGSMIHDFVPNDEVQTILGEHAAVMGDGMSKSEIAKLVIGSIMESAGEELALAIPTAKRVDDGNTTMDLFNGHLTVIRNAITDGKVSVEKKNLVILDHEITVENAVDTIKSIEFGLDQRLRKQERFLYCDPHIVDLYNEGYLLTHPAVPYNEKYEQNFVEGSNRRMTFAPLDGLAGTGVMWIAPKKNVIYGYDGMSDAEKCEILRFQPDTLTLNAKMFFGAGFRTFDFRFLKVIGTQAAITGKPTMPGLDLVDDGEGGKNVKITQKEGLPTKYTTDGSDPNDDSETYTQPLAADEVIGRNESATVKAIAVNEEKDEVSDIALMTFTQEDLRN